MQVIFNPDIENWDYLFDNLQYGSGASSYPYFIGSNFQRGNGVGGILKNLFKFLLPLGKRAGHLLAEEGINTASRVLNNLNSSSDPVSLLKTEAKNGLKNVLNKVANNNDTQEGSGKKRKYTPRKKAIAYTKVTPSKKSKIDALGLY